MTGFRLPARAIAAALPLLLSAAAAAQETTPWWRGATCYEVFVRSFSDSNGDGVGDLNGLIQRLDYLNDGDPAGGGDLGVQCLWLMPISESPSYHGYDVADYYHVDREYGTDEDFKRLMREAHRRGLRVIVDLVLNHSSSQLPAFQSALNDRRSPYRDWYRWLPEHPGVKNPWGGDNWHRSPVRDEFYYGFFWSGMPDLNYDTPAVRQEAKRIADHWIRRMGADGFRLDAVSFLVEEGHRQIQHTAGTHAVLREFGDFVRGLSPETFTVGEAWDSTAAVASYYPDQLDEFFAFELADSLVAAARRGVAAPALSAMQRTAALIPQQRWASFLRNHDQERTLSGLGGDRGAARAAAGLLMTLPGTPFIYYGEEIGMSGRKDGPEGDIGVRTPMQWSAAAHAGFSAAEPWHAPADGWREVNVAAQEADSASLLTLYRRLVHLRAENPALARGDWVPLRASHPGVAAYLRRISEQTVLVVINLSPERLSDVALSSEAGALPAGDHRLEALLGPAGAPLQARNDGSLEAYVPFTTLEPRTTYILQIHR